MVSPKKCRLQVTFHKETVAVLDNTTCKETGEKDD